jgi:hypothetical protein
MVKKLLELRIKMSWTKTRSAAQDHTGLDGGQLVLLPGFQKGRDIKAS